MCYLHPEGVIQQTPLPSAPATPLAAARGTRASFDLSWNFLPAVSAVSAGSDTRAEPAAHRNRPARQEGDLRSAVSAGSETRAELAHTQQLPQLTFCSFEILPVPTHSATKMLPSWAK